MARSPARAAPATAVAIAALLAAGCGGSTGRDGAAPGAGARARAALEQSVMSSVRVTPGAGSVASARCVRRDGAGRRWTCRLGGTAAQDIAVTVDGDGWWRADDVHVAAAPQMGPDASRTGRLATGVALVGCCVPQR